MILNRLFKLFSLCAVALMLLFTGCGDDDSAPDGVAGTIVGTWTGASATFDSFLIDGQDVSALIEELRQVLIDLGGSEAEADEFAQEFEDSLTEALTESFEGTFTFKADGTYEVSDDQGTDSGTWEVTNNDQALLFDRGTTDELEIEIVSYSDTRFEGLVDIEEQDDIDDDGSANTIAATLRIVFTR